MLRPSALCIRIFFLLLFSLFFLRVAYAIEPFNKYPTNPVLTVGPTAWDNTRVYLPSVIYYSGGLKMLYTGYSSRFQIGLATSIDAISWNKSLSNPVITKLSTNNKDTHDQTLFFDGSSEYVYYVASDSVGTNNFTVFRELNTDGVYVDNPSSPVFDPTSGWGSVNVSAPFVLKNSSGYHMWFISNDSGNIWKIGYASSSNGTIWTPYAGNPIITGANNPAKEGIHLGGPSVLYDESTNTYHMWYSSHFDNLSFTSYINYATSVAPETGWTKPTDKNPVIAEGPSGSFDGLQIGDPAVVKIGDTHLLYYTAWGTVNGESKIRIGLATDGPIVFPTLTPTPTETPVPTNTPTPSLTPTETPIPTNTPEPTPTPIPVTKVVVVPGLAGSWNSDAILNCNINSDPNTWTNWQISDMTYNPLITAIQNAGMTPLLFYYDWRKDPRDTADILTGYLANHTQEDEKVYLVGHSLGGLVARAYVKEFGIGKIARYLSVGSPHQGTVLAYPAWSAGDIWGKLEWKLAMNLIKLLCKQAGYINDRIIVRTVVPSVQTLLPTFPYLRDRQTDTLKPIASMNAQNNWLPDLPFPTLSDIMYGTFSGKGKSTLSEIVVKPRSPKDALLGNWQDGKPIRRINSQEGDDSVLKTSALLSSAAQQTLNLSHGQLVSTQPGINAILSFFDIPLPLMIQQAMPTEPITGLIVVSDNRTFTLMSPSGQSHEATNGVVFIPDAPDGDYQFRNISYPKSNRVAAIRIFTNDQIQSTYIKLNKRLPRLDRFRLSIKTNTIQALH